MLQYVATHGRITRREVAELCQLAPLQARDLLARLVAEGKRAHHGARRGAFYRLASNNMDLSKWNTDKSIVPVQKLQTRRPVPSNPSSTLLFGRSTAPRPVGQDHAQVVVGEVIARAGMDFRQARIPVRL